MKSLAITKRSGVSRPSNMKKRTSGSVSDGSVVFVMNERRYEELANWRRTMVSNIRRRECNRIKSPSDGSTVRKRREEVIIAWRCWRTGRSTITLNARDEQRFTMRSRMSASDVAPTAPQGSTPAARAYECNGRNEGLGTKIREGERSWPKGVTHSSRTREFIQSISETGERRRDRICGAGRISSIRQRHGVKLSKLRGETKSCRGGKSQARAS